MFRATVKVTLLNQPFNNLKTKKMKNTLITLTLLLFFGISTTTAQKPELKIYTYTGIVVSAVDGKPLKGAIVSQINVRTKDRTDKDGRFSFTTTRTNSAEVHAGCQGYETKMVPRPDGSTPLRVVLHPNGDPTEEYLSQFKTLKVGDKVPDIIMKDITNYSKKEMRISDFKGKLLILDFWSTNCAICIAAFPTMEKLQEKFPNEIQILLANGYESSETIKNVYMKKNGKIPNPALPMANNVRVLRTLFPSAGVPHHVWIDGDGIVRLIGSFRNTHEKKIKQFLNGEDIDFLSGFGDREELNKDFPFQSQVNGSVPVFSRYSSYFTDFNNDISPSGTTELNHVDSANQTIRNTFVNMDVLRIYSHIMKNNETWKKKIIGPNSLLRYHDVFILKVKDSLNYSTFGDGLVIDEVYKKNRYCYEQVHDISLSESERKSAMLHDLNRAFNKIYGAKGEVVKRVVPCYYLVRKGFERDYLQALGVKEKVDTKKNVNLKTQYVLSEFYRINEEKAPFVFDATDYHAAPESMTFKQWKKGDRFEDLIADLNAYGFDLVKGEKEVDMLVISED